MVAEGRRSYELLCQSVRLHGLLERSMSVQITRARLTNERETAFPRNSRKSTYDCPASSRSADDLAGRVLPRQAVLIRIPGIVTIPRENAPAPDIDAGDRGRLILAIHPGQTRPSGCLITTRTKVSVEPDREGRTVGDQCRSTDRPRDALLPGGVNIDQGVQPWEV